jgi:hypothetical protein
MTDFTESMAFLSIVIYSATLASSVQFNEGIGMKNIGLNRCGKVA